MAQKKYVSLTRLSSFLDNLKDTFALLSHKHTLSDISDYKVDTSLSSTSNNPVANKVVDAEFEAISEALTVYDLALDDKADASHTHDDRYYTETEIDTKLSGKANSSHTHDIGDVTNLQTTLNAKVPTSRTVNGKALSSNITLSASDVGAATSSHTHDDRYYTEAEIDSKVSTINTSISNVNTSIANITSGTTVIKEAEHALSADNATNATSATKATQDGNGKVISSTYETKTDASAKLTEAKSYADSAAATAANTVKNDLLNNAGSAYDTLKELGDLIDDNKDAIDALETVASGKADASHAHDITDVTGLQSALNGKAATSHGTHVTYSTTAPVMDGTASVGTASTVARSDHKHPTDTSRASKTEFDTHTADTTKHITSTERTNWNAAKTHADSAHAPSNAEKNQNAFSNIKVGSTTIAADTTTDTLTLEGSNVTITPDATNDKVTIAVADGTTSAKGVVQLTNSTSSTSTTTAATPNSVKSAYDLANTAKTNAATAQTKADSAYALAESKVDSLSDLGITATATELNYVDGVTSNIQTQLDNKANSSHTHDYLPLSGGTVTGTTVFSKVQDAAADSYNAPAVVIGGNPSTYHLELDNNEIQAKQNETKAGNLFLNSNGGVVHVGFDGLKMDSESSISPEYALSSSIGTADLPFNHMYGRYFNLYGAANTQYGRFRVGTTGTTSTAGVTTLELGNNTATGTAHNASGKITMYGSGTGFTNILPSTRTSGSNTVTLPSGTGTLVTDKDLDAKAETMASISTVTTAEYEALEEAEAINANTLYMITDAEEDDIELITVQDIDEICGVTATA